MEFRQLGGSGLKVPALSFGAGTFGGTTDFFRAWGSSDGAEATRLISICLEAGVNLFDTADVYSRGVSEEILGQAIHWQRGMQRTTPVIFAIHGRPTPMKKSRVSAASCW